MQTMASFLVLYLAIASAGCLRFVSGDSPWIEVSFFRTNDFFSIGPSAKVPFLPDSGEWIPIPEPP
jgi:hypothetical protein